MVSAPTLSPELIRQSTALARAISAATRNWAMYPPEHPSVEASVARLADALATSTAGTAFTFAVTPQTLLVAGVPLPPEPPVAETARLLHDRDILQITFLGRVPAPAVHGLLQLLSIGSDELRASGGPAARWKEHGDASIVIEQIDYEKILEDREIEIPLERRDDVWRSLVKAMTEGRTTFDELQQRRLLEIAGNVADIGDLATSVIAPKCGIDGSPLITTQAATVIAVFRHLTDIVGVMEPERLSDVFRNIAAATSALDPHVVLQMMQHDQSPQESPMVDRIAAAFDDAKVAQLLATALARDRKATARLAQVFDTIAPDTERKRRVLTMAQSMLSERDFGKAGQFKAAWESIEELLLTYNERPYVSDSYQFSLEAAGERAGMLGARGLPAELPVWIESLGEDNVRGLSVLLITDLLRLEDNADRAAEITRDMGALGEDLLLAGAFEDVTVVTRTLREGADNEKSIAAEACRAALTALGESVALKEAATLIGDLDNTVHATFVECCLAIGPTAVEALRPALESEHETIAFVRAREIVRKYGAAAISRIVRLLDSDQWFVLRNAAALLGATRSPEAVSPLQGLLRRNDPRVLRTAVTALAGIDDPSAARALQTVLRSASGANRAAVVAALAAERDPRVVPMLLRILAESDPFGADHQTVLDTLAAVRELADARAVTPVASVMRKKRVFARRKARAFKEASVQALRAIGTPQARQALEEAGRTGDRLLRRIIRTSQGLCL
jgi:hypothetical protein